TKMQNLFNVMGRRQDFTGMIFDDMDFVHPHRAGKSSLSRTLEKGARIGSRIQDPTVGTPGNTLARRYVVTALQHILATPTSSSLSVDQLIAALSQDPRYLKFTHPDAHQAAINHTAPVRSLKESVMAKVVQGIYEPLSS